MKWYHSELNNLLYNRQWKVKAKRTRQEVFKFVGTLKPNRYFTSGSFARKTNLQGADIDIFVVLEPNSNNGDILKAREDLKKNTQKKYQKNFVREQPHTVGVIVKDITFDLIPAFEMSKDKFLIPEGDDTLETEPLKSKARVKDLNRETSGTFSHFTRLIK